MRRRRSPLSTAAIAFALLSIAMHVAIWNAARAPTRHEGGNATSPAPVQLVALAAPEPAREPASAVPVPESAPNLRPVAAAKPVRNRAAKPRPAPARALPAAAPDPQAWRRPVALPEFDDSIDAGNLFAAAPGRAARASAVSAGEDEAPAPSEPATPAPAPPAQAPPTEPKALSAVAASGSARYRVHFGDPADGNVVAMLEQRYEIDKGRYRLHSEGRATGLASWFYRGTLLQESTGRVSVLGLQPERYRERRGERSEKEAVLDATAERVRFASGAESALPQGAQDRLSVFVQLGLLLQSHPSRFTPGAVVEIPVLASSRVEPASFRVLGNETVDAGEAQVAALHLRRDPLDDDEPAIDLWLSLEPRVLPLRVRMTESSGRSLDQIVVVDDDR